MGTLPVILVLVSAFVALVASVSALRAYLKLRRARVVLRARLYPEVDLLARRATEIEKNLAALDARAAVLPVQISELQQNLATLRVLANVLGTTLRQTRKVLSSTSLTSSLVLPLLRAFTSR